MRTAKIAPFVSILMIACGGSSSPTGPTPAPTPVPVTRSVISISVAPDPILAIPSGDPAFPWTMNYTLRVTETAGLGCNVNTVIRTYKDKATGLEIVTGTSNPNDVIERAGTNHIVAMGGLDIGAFSLTYRGSNNGRQLVLTVTVEVIDDAGNRFSTSKDINVL